MWTTRQGWLAMLFAVLGGAAWWLVRDLTQETPRRPHGRVPNHVVWDLNAVQTDAAGQPKQHLIADQLRQFTDEDRSELEAPRLTLYDPAGAPPWRAASRHGVLLSNGTEVRLNDEVRIERAGSALSRSVRIATSELTIWPKREYAQGDQPVRIESDRDWLTAAGIKLWYATPSRSEYRGRVHIYIAPVPSETASTRETAP